MSHVEFKHESFIQFRPDLLFLIKRSTLSKAPTEEIQILKQKIQSCEEKIEVMSNKFESKIEGITQIMQQKILQLESIMKRRKKKRRQHTKQTSNKRNKRNTTFIKDWEQDFISFYLGKLDGTIVNVKAH